MRRLILLALILLATLLPGWSLAGYCSPLTCSPSQVMFAHSSLLGVRSAPESLLRVLDLRTGRTAWRLPGGVVARNVLVHADNRLVTWFDVVHGTRVRDVLLQQHGAFALVGAAQDGGRAVLARTQHRLTTFAIVSPQGQRIVKLGGSNWQFDALNGDNLFLIRTLRVGYDIRLLHVRSGVLERAPLKDPHSLVTISGSAWRRVSSVDGRFLYTLYVAPNGGSMVHVLDTRAATARCIDLPGTGSWNAATTYALVIDPEPRYLWAISPGYGRVVHIDLVTRRVDDSYRFAPGAWSTNAAVAVMSPDGEEIAVTDAYHLWFVHLAARKVVRGATHVAIALAWSPDQRHLWAIGERSRVSSLPVR